jgi:4-alpha-glucanotransferase
LKLPRSSGILLHPTSLPGGRLGDEAYRFVDWLEAAGQSWWQMLPLGPPDEFRSPYASPSAFAASPALLAKPDARVTQAEMDDFVARHPYWIGEWARFARSGAIEDQVRFEREWSALRAYAHDRGVRLIGDVPIYVSGDGADVDARPELFQRGQVAGAPPDALNANGQYWGNPLYDWPVHRATDYHWWIERSRRTFELVDLARVDHFRGYVSYWAIPAHHRTARRGKWRRGPGAELFRAVERGLGELPVIAEDLGVITPAVHRVRNDLGLPGTVVMLWAFRTVARNTHRLDHHRVDQVVYTSTHDTNTAVGWFRDLKQSERAATGLDPADPSWSLIDLCLGSPASLAVIPAQDVLGLGSEARMNRPGHPHGNWSWRLAPGQLTPALAERLRAATERHRRLHT